MEFQLPASNDGLHCILAHVALCQYLTLMMCYVHASHVPVMFKPQSHVLCPPTIVGVELVPAICTNLLSSISWTLSSQCVLHLGQQTELQKLLVTSWWCCLFKIFPSSSCFVDKSGMKSQTNVVLEQ